jgi:hypothetical protein
MLDRVFTRGWLGIVLGVSVALWTYILLDFFGVA